MVLAITNIPESLRVTLLGNQVAEITGLSE